MARATRGAERSVRHARTDFPCLARTPRSPAPAPLQGASLAGAAAGVCGSGAGFAVQRRYFPAKVPVVARAFFVMWTGFMPFMLMKGVTQNKMQKAARAATTDMSRSPKP
eukprot:scaffold118886_cov58-Phaeocystis_antarctica.AAC.1